MPSELFGTSVIFVKVAPGYVEKTLTTLRAKPHVAKAEAVFGRHDIAISVELKFKSRPIGLSTETTPAFSKYSTSTHGRARLVRPFFSTRETRFLLNDDLHRMRRPADLTIQTVTGRPYSDVQHSRCRRSSVASRHQRSLGSRQLES